ncbi:phage holin [Bacillus altitudinis]|uniref:phage holin n=1 Tax=Bacillus TaxID=1386 RepID=UPI0007650EC6|nr:MULTISPECIES: phage holin [Bacillus]MCA1019607.1 phage holin [Bacillus stratosphericus]CVN32020.1 holin%2C SPP1 family [Streptococcus pneumoniae]MBS4748451.1 phage holin [Bacillus altitudinis]MBU8968905.1 phage holin [Bacillus altitudinis]MBV5113415.1 phage holin [Bacillus altitudinis]
MKTFDKGTVIRTVLLFIALINQTLVMFGQTVLPISEEQVQTVGEALYVAGSTIFTMVTAMIAWFKNNYVTYKGQLQKDALKQRGLTK